LQETCEFTSDAGHPRVRCHDWILRSIFSGIASFDNPNTKCINGIPGNKHFTLGRRRPTGLLHPHQSRPSKTWSTKASADTVFSRSHLPGLNGCKPPTSTLYCSNHIKALLTYRTSHPIDHRSLNARTSTAAPVGLLGQIPPERLEEKVSTPTHLTSVLVPLTLPPHHQYNPCRGSSIGRACGSYDSKEINLKVVGSSPTFGYSYIKAH
jgi:hypothetical protein